jgi:chromosome segregation ATPase
LECERAEKRRQEQRLAGLAKDLEQLHARASEYFECERLTQAKLSGLEQTLHERDEALVRAAADVQKEAAERALIMEQLRAAEALVAELRDGGVVFISAKNALQRRHEELETRLQAAMSALNEAQSQLQNEKRERAKLEEKLTTLQRQLQEQIIETSKFQCANEVGQAERKRLEGDAIQLRYASAGAARASLLAVNQLQNEVREPLDKIVAATRRLLELETGEDTNKLIQCVLVNGLAMQNKLQEFTPPPTAFAESQPLATSGT